MKELALNGKTVLVTGAARRIGRALALACASAGADVIVHHGHSPDAALEVKQEINSMGRKAWILQANLDSSSETERLVSEANALQSLYAVVNNAAIFEPLTLQETTRDDWDRHFRINLTAPFLLSRTFAHHMAAEATGRIVNILDWRALRPKADHFPYTISKAALAALTESLAVALAPNITVNGLALGAILPPSDKPVSGDIIKAVPAGRWGDLKEVQEALLFLLTGPNYITGEIIHVDGGRHLA